MAPILADAPFPCFTVDRLFDWNFYHQLIKNLPSKEEYVQTRAERTSNQFAYESRTKIALTDQDQLARIDPQKKQIWQELAGFFQSDHFITTLFMKYKPFLKERYGDALRFEPKVRLELIRDCTGYRINPHTDATHKIFTSLIYLPKQLTDLDLGTSIYRHENPDFRCEAGGQYDPMKQSFHEIFRAPYQPGRMFSFMKTDNSFHGREPIERENVERNLMICTVQHGQAFIGS